MNRPRIHKDKTRKLEPEKLLEAIEQASAYRTFTDDALGLIVRSSEGIFHRVRNVCVASLLEAVRDRTKTVDLKRVNRVLLQPHWRQGQDVS